MPTISSSSPDLARRAARVISGRCARSTSESWVPMLSTGLSAFIELCSTTAISFQRSPRSWRWLAVSRLTDEPKRAWPAVMMPGGRSSRVIA